MIPGLMRHSWRGLIAAVFAVAFLGVVGSAYANPDETEEADALSASSLEQRDESILTSLVIAGETQYDTSAEQAVRAFPEGSTYAIVASGNIPVDALAATSLAGVLECPIMLTDKYELPSSVALALTTLGAEKVIVVGGPAVIDEDVEQALRDKHLNVERLYGESQYDTQMEIYGYGEERGLWNSSDTLVIASGNIASAADALSASPIAYRLKAPVVLVDDDGLIPTETARKLATQTQYNRALVIGGTAVVSDVSYGYMEALTMFNAGKECVIRLAGETLYDTSAVVAKWATEQGILSWNGLAFATGRTPFDSLGGSVFQGVSGSVLLLIDSDYLVGLDATASSADSLNRVIFFGGEAVMPSSLRALICERLPVAVPEDGDEIDIDNLGKPSSDNEGKGEDLLEADTLENAVSDDKSLSGSFENDSHSRERAGRGGSYMDVAFEDTGSLNARAAEDGVA